MGAGNNLYHRAYFASWQTWRGEGPYWAGQWGFAPGAVSQASILNVFEVGSDHSGWHIVTAGAAHSAGTRR